MLGFKRRRHPVCNRSDADVNVCPQHLVQKWPTGLLLFYFNFNSIACTLFYRYRLLYYSRYVGSTDAIDPSG